MPLDFWLGVNTAAQSFTNGLLSGVMMRGRRKIALMSWSQRVRCLIVVMDMNAFAYGLSKVWVLCVFSLSLPAKGLKEMLLRAFWIPEIQYGRIGPVVCGVGDLGQNFQMDLQSELDNRVFYKVVDLVLNRLITPFVRPLHKKMNA